MRARIVLVGLLVLVGCSRPKRVTLETVPSEMILEYAMGCARENGIVECWDDSPKHTFDKRPTGARRLTGIGTPKKIVIGGDRVCVLDAQGIACVTSYEISYLTALGAKRDDSYKNPIDIVGTQDGICVLEQSGVVKCGAQSRPAQRATFISSASKLAATVDRYGFCARQGDEWRCGRYTNYPESLTQTFRVAGLSADAHSFDVDDRHFFAIDHDALVEVVHPVLGLRPSPDALATAKPDPKVPHATALVRDSIWRYALDGKQVKKIDPDWDNEHGQPWPTSGPVDALFRGPESRFFARQGSELWEYGWDRGKRVAKKISGVTDPRSAGFDLYQSCALDAQGVSCWKRPER